MNLFNTLLEFVIGLISKKEIGVEVTVPIEDGVKEESKAEESTPIDWANGSCMVSKYFSVHEMIYLPTWKRLANEADGLNDEIKGNLIKLGQKMDIVREYFNRAINVHVTYRPLEYNKAIGGALHSAHSDGEACDFDIMGMTCDEVRAKLIEEGLLEKWEMRCEKAPGTNWVHLDYRELKAGGNRYFIP